jgi:TPR repeat protein
VPRTGWDEESLKLFERAAAKGHEDAIWVMGVVEGVTDKNDVKEAFAQTKEPLGYYLAGKLSDYQSDQQAEFYNKSAEGGCSWGLMERPDEDEDSGVEWLLQAAQQNNPMAMAILGGLAQDEDVGKALSYFRAAAELGWKGCFDWLAGILSAEEGEVEGCVRDLRQAAMCSAQSGGDFDVFWYVLEEANRAFQEGKTAADLGYDLNQLCYALGWALYWYVYESEDWKDQWGEQNAFDLTCVSYYCTCVELQQESIFTFLLCWNRRSGGVKDVGLMIAKMVWEGREDNLVKAFGQ